MACSPCANLLFQIIIKRKKINCIIFLLNHRGLVQNRKKCTINVIISVEGVEGKMFCGV
jgi:hypothetical protein